jgi:hypothetical protein
MARRSRAFLVALAVLVAAVVLPPDATAQAPGDTVTSLDQGRDRRRAPPPPPRQVVRRPAKRGTFVFIGGYFYDPFFGPYPWWPRQGYPPWYYPIYDDRAEVRISCSSRDAAVYVDGFYAGIVDDFDGVFQHLGLPPGGHRISLYLPGFTTAEFSVYLRPGSTFTLRHSMERQMAGESSVPPAVSAPVPPPPPGSYNPPRGVPPAAAPSAPMPPVDGEIGTVELRVQPATAVVTIDGARWLSSDPGLFVVQVAAGLHRVEITAPGYRPFAQDVQVRAGESAPLNVSLVRTPDERE